MTADLKQAAFTAFAMLMRPIARLLLRCGVTWKELAELLKIVYVDVATQDYGKHGRPANASRVAILTGLSRREVARVRRVARQQAQGSFAPLARINHATRVLSGWHQDPDFVDAKGRPRLLPPQGRAGFELLVKRYAPDIPPTAMLKELTRVGAVRETPAGKLRVMTRYFVPAGLENDAVVRTGSVIKDLADTITHNQLREDRLPRFERRATNLHVKPSARAAFRTYIESKGMTLLEEADAWLSAHEVGSGEERSTRLGVGVYLIMDE
jgi:hypothetical protein